MWTAESVGVATSIILSLLVLRPPGWGKHNLNIVKEMSEEQSVQESMSGSGPVEVPRSCCNLQSWEPCRRVPLQSEAVAAATVLKWLYSWWAELGAHYMGDHLVCSKFMGENCYSGLGLNLSESHFRIYWPEWRDLDGHCQDWGEECGCETEEELNFLYHDHIWVA